MDVQDDRYSGGNKTHYILKCRDRGIEMTQIEHRHCDKCEHGGLKHKILCSWLSRLTFMDPWCFLWSILRRELACAEMWVANKRQVM